MRIDPSCINNAAWERATTKCANATLSRYILSGAGMPKSHKPFLNIARRASACGPRVRNEAKVHEAGADGARLAAEVVGDVPVRLFCAEHFLKLIVIFFCPSSISVGMFFTTGQARTTLPCRRIRSTTGVLRAYRAKEILFKCFFLTLRKCCEFLACRIRICAEMPVCGGDLGMQFERALVEPFEKKPGEASHP